MNTRSPSTRATAAVPIETSTTNSDICHFLGPLSLSGVHPDSYSHSLGVATSEHVHPRSMTRTRSREGAPVAGSADATPDRFAERIAPGIRIADDVRRWAPTPRLAAPNPAAVHS